MEQLLKDLCVEMVNHPNCSGSDAVQVAYLLFSREDRNFVYEPNVILGEDEYSVMEEPF